MAPKLSKSDILESPPSASSSENSSSHEDGGEDSSEVTPLAKPAAQKPQSSSSGDSGSSSESDSEPEAKLRSAPAPEPPAKPLPSKQPMEQQASNKKARSKPAAASKRPSETQIEKKETKKAKQVAEGGKADGVAEKSTPRLWTEDEEITVLKGMIEYDEKIGFNPSSDMEAFHAFIKKSLRSDASRNQLYEKVRRLKKKYWDNVEKLKKDENVISSWKPHDRKAFELSKKIWRSEGNGLQSPKPSGKSKANQNQSANKPTPKLPEAATSTQLVPAAREVEENGEDNGAERISFDWKLGSGDVERFVLEKGLNLIKGPKKAEFEDRWSKLRKAELELYVERTRLIREQAKMLLELM